jgi:NAD(P)H dehydrogenase (quinone)
MKTIGIVFHSGYGHTRKVAEAVQEGIQASKNATAELMEIDQNGEISSEQWDSLKEADGIVFGSPTYMGTVSWQFKKFADASSKVWAKQGWRNKLAAGFTNSASMNGDKEVTLQTLFTLAMQHGMLWTGPGLFSANTKDSQRNDINYLGAYIGLMTQSPADASPEEAPPPGDIETARVFGKRLAEVVNYWNPPA